MNEDNFQHAAVKHWAACHYDYEIMPSSKSILQIYLTRDFKTIVLTKLVIILWKPVVNW